jgi:hypothetical protein
MRRARRRRWLRVKRSDGQPAPSLVAGAGLRRPFDHLGRTIGRREVCAPVAIRAVGDLIGHLRLCRRDVLRCGR